MAVNYARLVKCGPDQIRSLFESKQVRPRDIDLGKAFAEAFGWRAFLDCRAGKTLANDVFRQAVTEAEGAVSTAAFQSISGQFVYQNVLDAYESEEFVFTKLIPEAQASTLDGEKIPGITEIGDELAVRNEGDPYALAGVGEDWIFTPQIKDRGVIVPVTWEAIFNDKTGLLAGRCADVGKWAGVNVEKRAADCVVDENTTAHRYNWRGTVIATYGDNSGSHTWDNLAASNALVDWTDIDTAEQLFNGLTDPYTGEPIMIEPRHLIVTKQLEAVARYNLSATSIATHVGGYATSGNLNEVTYDNPWRAKYELVTSKLLASRMATDTSWFLADVSKLAKRMVAEPLTVVQAPTNNADEFNRRIVSQHRVNERSAFVVVQPRAAVKSTA